MISKRKLIEADFELWNSEFGPLKKEHFLKLLDQIRHEEKIDRGYSYIFEDSGEFVAFAQIFNIERHPFHNGKLEISVSKNKRKLGLGKRVTESLLDIAFNELKLLKVIAPISPENDASIALAKSLGFKKIGTDPSYLFINGKPFPQEIYVLLKD